MATKKKTRKKPKKSKRTARKKATAKTTVKRPKSATKSPTRKKAKKKASSKKQAQKKKSRRRGPLAFSPKGERSHSGEQSGDLQGLSRSQAADSESVEELLEEGNAFEADAVVGVEDAENSDEKEVRTHEVPEDDVPDEYLDKE